jgi:hypothetical protein
MHAVKRRFDDCPICENRGLICVGDDDQDSPCPRCNAWCPFCLEQPVAERRPHVMDGALFAAVQRTDAGLELFEGYLCDWHKRFQSYIGIAPAMIGRFKPGDAFITVQTFLERHAFVELYGYAEAENWRDLEADAFRAVAAQPWSPYGRYGEYPCPPELAARAVPPDWVTWQVGAIQERRELANGSRLTTWSITER